MRSSTFFANAIWDESSLINPVQFVQTGPAYDKFKGRMTQTETEEGLLGTARMKGEGRRTKHVAKAYYVECRRLERRKNQGMGDFLQRSSKQPTGY